MERSCNVEWWKKANYSRYCVSVNCISDDWYFLPDEDEKDDDDPIEEYTFDKSGEFTEEVLKEYTTKFGEVMQNIEEYEKPFGSSALSDEALGI